MQVRASTALARAAGGARGAAADDHLSTLVVKLQLLSQVQLEKEIQCQKHI